MMNNSNDWSAWARAAQFDSLDQARAEWQQLQVNINRIKGGRVIDLYGVTLLDDHGQAILACCGRSRLPADIEAEVSRTLNAGQDYQMSSDLRERLFTRSAEKRSGAVQRAMGRMQQGSIPPTRLDAGLADLGVTRLPTGQWCMAYSFTHEAMAARQANTLILQAGVEEINHMIFVVAPTGPSRWLMYIIADSDKYSLLAGIATASTVRGHFALALSEKERTVIEQVVATRRLNPLTVNTVTRTAPVSSEPFIAVYTRYKVQSTLDFCREKGQPEELATSIGKNSRRGMKSLAVYHFDESALRMLHAVLSHGSVFVPPVAPFFVRFSAPVELPSGVQVAAMAIFPQSLTSVAQDPELRERFAHASTNVQQMLDAHLNEERYQWNIEVIGGDYRMNYDFTYDAKEARMIHLVLHTCPHYPDGCLYPGYQEEVKSLKTEGVRLCSKCRTDEQAVIDLVMTAQRMINHEFALEPSDLDRKDWPTQIATSKERVRKPVGKGKNRHLVDAEQEQEWHFHVVSYEVSEMSRTAYKEAKEQEGESAGNWITWAKESGKADAIIWERRPVRSHTRHLDPEINPRWKMKKDIDIEIPWRKTPFLREKAKSTIRRVHAKKYEQLQVSEEKERNNEHGNN